MRPQGITAYLVVCSPPRRRRPHPGEELSSHVHARRTEGEGDTIPILVVVGDVTIITGIEGKVGRVNPGRRSRYCLGRPSNRHHQQRIGEEIRISDVGRGLPRDPVGSRVGIGAQGHHRHRNGRGSLHFHHISRLSPHLVAVHIHEAPVEESRTPPVIPTSHRFEPALDMAGARLQRGRHLNAGLHVAPYIAAVERNVDHWCLHPAQTHLIALWGNERDFRLRVVGVPTRAQIEQRGKGSRVPAGGVHRGGNGFRTPEGTLFAFSHHAHPAAGRRLPGNPVGVPVNARRQLGHHLLKGRLPLLVHLQNITGLD